MDLPALHMVSSRTHGAKSEESEESETLQSNICYLLLTFLLS